jgi:4-hydroxy-tetrahydrodipicolinate reductase
VLKPFDFAGDLVWIQTKNLLIRSQMLYSVELRSQSFFFGRSAKILNQMYITNSFCRRPVWHGFRLYLHRMKIALIGYGKMGNAIERVALSRGHEIVLCITSANREELTPDNLARADAAIEFTRPEAALDNVKTCIHAGVPVVSGTTGWNHELAIAGNLAREMGGALLHASNFSIGMNLFFQVNKLLATLMTNRSEYNPYIEETHHIHKKDAPSGTAITLAEQILARQPHFKNWLLNDMSEPDGLPVLAYRIDEIPGTHTVVYASAVDDIQITHKAHNRDGFALGAVLCAEFIAGKKGVFSMDDVLGLRNA